MRHELWWVRLGGVVVVVAVYCMRWIELGGERKQALLWIGLRLRGGKVCVRGSLVGDARGRQNCLLHCALAIANCHVKHLELVAHEIGERTLPSRWQRLRQTGEL